MPADRRGDGLATAGMAAVVHLVRREIAPVGVALRQRLEHLGRARVYERVGFRETARFATVMF